MKKQLSSIIREPVNSLTHAVGALAAVVGLVFMIYDSSQRESYLAIMASLFFGISMILLYSSSAAYHWVMGSDNRILWLKRVDHMMIFILIAGSYTPYCLIALPSPMSWIVFGIVWGIAVGGVLLKLLWIHAPRWISTGIYLGMGWMSVAIFPSMVDTFTLGGYIWLGLGGLAYTIGAVIYALKKPDPFPLKFGFHEIWHIFVMAGTFCHFWSIYNYVLPIV
ncbi:hemolysin III family protein [bacterium]|nr:MAG: hemolysin III family protein [bacterium]